MPCPTVLIYSVLGKGRCHSFITARLQIVLRIVLDIEDSLEDNYAICHALNYSTFKYIRVYQKIWREANSCAGNKFMER